MQVLIDAEGMMKVTHMIQMPNLQHENWGAMPSGHDSSQQVELLSSFWQRSSDLRVFFSASIASHLGCVHAGTSALRL